MKLDHPSMFAIEHSAGGFGMPDTPTSDEGTYVVPWTRRSSPLPACATSTAPTPICTPTDHLRRSREQRTDRPIHPSAGKARSTHFESA